MKKNECSIKNGLAYCTYIIIDERSCKYYDQKEIDSESYSCCKHHPILGSAMLYNRCNCKEAILETKLDTI